MSIINNGLLLAAEAAAAPAAGISRSLRFNSADSAYLNRTPASAGNRKTWTWSSWVKRCRFGNYEHIFNGTGSSPSYAQFYWSPTEQLVFDNGGSGSITTTQVFRDPSAWYHLVLAFDTTQATAANRMRMYVNGQEITTFSSSSYPSQNTDGGMNQASVHYIGKENVSYSGLYLADAYFIDGQALDPTSFGEFDATTGAWNPITYSGSYGTNGFRLTFSDNSGTTSTTLGKDAAGSNNWTPNNFSVAAGSGNDSLVDVPTNGDQTDTGAGGEVRGNYCTWNAVDNGGVTLSNGNLDTVTAASWKAVRGTIGVSSGKWYWEYTMTAAGYTMLGMTGASAALNTYAGVSPTGYAFYSLGGGSSKWNNNASASYGDSFTTNDVIGVAFDADNGKIWFAKNGTWQASGNPASGTNTAYSSIPAGTYFPTVSQDNSSGATGGATNFGARAFAYTAPSGFKALCTANLPTPTIAKPSTVMDVAPYSGNSGTTTISGLGFSPDLVWLKGRSQADRHYLFDTVRGKNALLASNETTSETDYSSLYPNYLQSFNSDGFTLGYYAAQGGLNKSGETYVTWMWDAGSSTVSNTDGSITSSVRANASAGFSVVGFNPGSTTGNQTIGHGLNASPSLIIMRTRDSSSNWLVFHRSVCDTVKKLLRLNTTDGLVTDAYDVWGASLPSSTTFGVLPTISVAQNQNHIAYCFAPVAGYSAFGSYTGNGSSTGDGPFIYTGMRPRFLLIKRTNNTGEWVMVDTARDSYNIAGQIIYANTSGAEFDDRGIGASNQSFDFLSNGFKLKGGNARINASGSTYVFAAFAESPFAYSRAR